MERPVRGGVSGPARDNLFSTGPGTDAARPTEDGSSGGKDAERPEDRAYLSLNRMESVGREEMNKALPSQYGKEYIAELALGLRLAPTVDLFFGKAEKFERSENTPWAAHDDGWRLRLQTNF